MSDAALPAERNVWNAQLVQRVGGCDVPCAMRGVGGQRVVCSCHRTGTNQVATLLTSACEPQALLSTLVALPAEPSDDAMRSSPLTRHRSSPLSWSFAATLPDMLASATLARHLVGQLLEPTASKEEQHTAELLTTELVSNALAHTSDGCELRLTCDLESLLRVEVADDGDDTPAVASADVTGSHGRGLHIVDGLADRWGVEPGATAGKIVWFELQLSRAASEPADRTF